MLPMNGNGSGGGAVEEVTLARYQRKAHFTGQTAKTETALNRYPRHILTP